MIFPARRRPAGGTDPSDADPSGPGAAGRGGPGQARAEAVLSRLQLLVIRKLDGLLQGDYTGLLPGPGSEAGESREYRPGDDVRRMDWPVTARTTVPHVRQTVADRELETWLAIDLSASLDFGTARWLKRDLVIAAAAAMIHLTARGGNRIGAVVGTGGQADTDAPAAGRFAGWPWRRRPGSDQSDGSPSAAGGSAGTRSAAGGSAGGSSGAVPPGSGWSGALPSGSGWSGAPPSGAGSSGAGRPASGRPLRLPARPGRKEAHGLLRAIATTEVRPGRTDLGELVDMLNRPPRRRGVAVIISDFLAPPEQWGRPVRKLAVRHDVLAVEVVDPRELELPDVGVLPLVDPETGEWHEVQTADPVLRRRYAEAASVQRAAIAQTLRAAGAAHLRLRTDSDWLLDMVRFVAAQRHARTRGTTR